jgi:hypothetical protein
MAETYESAQLQDKADGKRRQAKRCRVIVKDMESDGPGATLLTAYAVELEEGAGTLERSASDLRVHGAQPGNRGS